MKKKSKRRRFLPEFRPSYYRIVTRGDTRHDPVRQLQIMDIRHSSDAIEIEVVG